MSETPQYDLGAVLAVAQTQDLVFVGREATEMLHKFFVENPGSVGKVEVAMFPYYLDADGNPVPASRSPRRGVFTGTLLSSQLNERGTKGRFVFSDGTVIYRDNTILD